MRSLRILVSLILLLAAGAAAVIWSGLYDVSAAVPENPWVARVLDTAKDRSIDRRLADVPAPPSLTDPATIRTGLVHFNDMCVTCHGAPGVSRSEAGMGLNPDAPDLKDEAAHSSPQHLFWVIKNGIKMTGMPAFGPTHTDDKIWAMVAFLKQLPTLDPQTYAAHVKELTDAPSPASPPPTAPPTPHP